MEHHNHKLVEVVTSFLYDADPTHAWDLSAYADLMRELKGQGFRAEQRQPVQIKVEFRSTDEVPTSQFTQTPHTTVLFQNATGNRVIWVMPASVSFHAIGTNQYTSWADFKDQFVRPYKTQCDAYVQRRPVRGAQHIYINEFELPPAEQLADYFTAGVRADAFGAGPEVQSFSQHVFRPEPYLELRIDLQMQAPSAEHDPQKVRLELYATAYQRPGQPVADDTLMEEAHACARRAFDALATDNFKLLIR